MIWHSEGGGPWGTGPRGGGPWGGGRGNGQGPGGPRGPQPPNIEEILRRSQDRLRRAFPGGFGFGTGKGLALVVVAIVLLWLASGFYRVLPDEAGIVLRFGAYNRTTPAGLNYHLPTPIETVLRPSITRINRTEIGFRSGDGGTRAGTSRDLPQEALMLTGDENIVDINLTVFWIINVPAFKEIDASRRTAGDQSYLFNIRNPEGTLKSAAESAMREVVGQTPIAHALSEGRGKIETDTQHLLQGILDAYGAGIAVTCGAVAGGVAPIVTDRTGVPVEGGSSAGVAGARSRSSTRRPPLSGAAPGASGSRQRRSPGPASAGPSCSPTVLVSASVAERRA